MHPNTGTPALYLNDPVQTPMGSGIVHDWTPGQSSVCVKFAADRFRWFSRSSVTHKFGL